MIEVQNLTKTFSDPKTGPFHAVDGATFSSDNGQILGLIGGNGAGKTTTLRILGTMLKPSSGTARVNGYDVTKDSMEVRRNLGFLSTSTALYARLKPTEMLAYFAELYGLGAKESKARIDELVERLGIHEFADRLCDKLSTGQKQKVSIARSIIHDPTVIIFDEPTTGLDVVTSQLILEFIEDCKVKGKTVILSTHIMSECERLCDKVSIIDKGKILASGTIPELMAQTGTHNFEKAYLSVIGYDREKGAGQ